MARVSKNIEFIKDKVGKLFIKANSIVFDDNESLEDIINNKLLKCRVVNRVAGKTVTIDTSEFRGAKCFAFMVVARAWVAGASSAIFVVEGIQNTAYMDIYAIHKNGYDIHASLSNGNVVLTFFNQDGGSYTIIPLIK